MKKKLILISILILAIVIAGCTYKKDSISTNQKTLSDKNVKLESGKFLSEDKDVFKEFVQNTWEGKKDSIILEYLEDGSLGLKIELTFDGGKYKYHTLDDSEYVLEEYKYLRYFEGTYKDRYTYADYILTNDEDMTYESLQTLIIDSNPSAAETTGKAGFRYLLAEHKDLE